MQIIFIVDAVRSGESIVKITTQENFLLNIIAGLLVLTLIFVLLRSILKSTISIIKTYRFVSTLTILDEQDGLVYIENDFNHAFTAGILRPKIYISDKLLETLNEKELNAVKEHEKFHQKTFDPFLKVVVDFVKNAMPFFPFKRRVFDSYEVLVELSADLYAERKLNTKLDVITALNKMIDLSNYNRHLNFSSFSLNNERIPILVENKVFKTKSYFIFFAFVLFSVMINTYLISNTNIFLECQHIVECINALFNQASDINFNHHEICNISDNFSQSYHCIGNTDQVIL
jgi:hypothetical protein